MDELGPMPLARIRSSFRRKLMSKHPKPPRRA